MEKKILRRFSRNPNSQPFDHESGAVPAIPVPLKVCESGNTRYTTLHLKLTEQKKAELNTRSSLDWHGALGDGTTGTVQRGVTDSQSRVVCELANKQSMTVPAHLVLRLA